jgi:hypothetical protein
VRWHNGKRLVSHIGYSDGQAVGGAPMGKKVAMTALDTPGEFMIGW